MVKSWHPLSVTDTHVISNDWPTNQGTNKLTIKPTSQPQPTSANKRTIQQDWEGLAQLLHREFPLLVFDQGVSVPATRMPQQADTSAASVDDKFMTNPTVGFT